MRDEEEPAPVESRDEHIHDDGHREPDGQQAEQLQSRRYDVSTPIAWQGKRVRS